MQSRMRTAAASIAAAALLAGSAGPAQATARPTEPSLTGSAQLYRLDGQDVHFTFDAHGFADQAHGTFRFTHRAGEFYGWADAKVDCLITGGPVATVTGVVTDSNLPELIGHRKGISVLDDGHHDRLGYNWALSDEVDPQLCMSMAPFETVRTGDFVVEHWTPPLPR
jgi:hypothetical protein